MNDQSIPLPPDSGHQEDDSINEHKAIRLYHRVEEWCRREIAAGSVFLFDPILFRTTLTTKSQEFQFPYLSLQSFFRGIHVQHIKTMSFKIQSSNQFETKYLPQYTEARRSIRQIAQDANFSPYLMARLVVDHVAKLEDSNRKKSLTNAMRDPVGELGTLDSIREEYWESEHKWREKLGKHKKSQVRIGLTSMNSSTTTWLAMAVKEAIDSDPLVGPVSDRAKHFIGIEYEIALEHMLKKRGIPFVSESQLREKGTSKTPDIVLDCPIAVQMDSQWCTITWIDAKAMYGDVHTHRQYQEQCDSYIHRFGPGMILYFFGHAPLSLLEDTNAANGDLVIMGWQFPDTVMWPDGTISNGGNVDASWMPPDTKENGTL